MALSKRLSLYTDVHTVLDAAVQHGGGRITLPTAGKARHWCQRANYYRKLLHAEQEERSGIVGTTTSTPYDVFVFAQDKEDKSIVEIRFAPLPTSFVAPDGTEVDLKRASTEMMEQIVEVAQESDPLMDEALNLAKSLTGGQGDE